MIDDNAINTGGGWKRGTNSWQRETIARDKHKYYCSCGHSVIIPYSEDKKMCTWCNHWVDKKKVDEKRYFRDKMRQLLNRREK